MTMSTKTVYLDVHDPSTNTVRRVPFNYDEIVGIRLLDQANQPGGPAVLDEEGELPNFRKVVVSETDPTTDTGHPVGTRHINTETGAVFYLVDAGSGESPEVWAELVAARDGVAGPLRIKPTVVAPENAHTQKGYEGEPFWYDNKVGFFNGLEGDPASLRTIDKLAGGSPAGSWGNVYAAYVRDQGSSSANRDAIQAELDAARIAGATLVHIYLAPGMVVDCSTPLQVLWGASGKGLALFIGTSVPTYPRVQLPGLAALEVDSTGAVIFTGTPNEQAAIQIGRADDEDTETSLRLFMMVRGIQHDAEFASSRGLVGEDRSRMTDLGVFCAAKVIFDRCHLGGLEPVFELASEGSSNVTWRQTLTRCSNAEIRPGTRGIGSATFRDTYSATVRINANVRFDFSAHNSYVALDTGSNGRVTFFARNSRIGGLDSDTSVRVSHNEGVCRMINCVTSAGFFAAGAVTVYFHNVIGNRNLGTNVTNADGFSYINNSTFAIDFGGEPFWEDVDY